MKRLLFLLGFVFAVALPSSAQTFNDLSSDLPEVMSAATEMRYVADGGMTRNFTRITISGNTLLVEQLTSKDRAPKKQSMKFSAN